MTAKTLGRPRQFDTDAALDTIERQFHEHGYHATTVADLLAATGLHKGSLYAAFGTKRSVFTTVLTRYADRRLALLDTDFAAEPAPLGGLRRYLRRQAAEAAGGRGCLLANSALELLPADTEVRSIVSGHQRRVEGRLAGALEQALARGDLTGVPRPRSAARALLVTVQGLWETGRTTNDVRCLVDVVDTVLGAFR
ncbi:TetR/AcrR family transcriptional regulator [Streptomyces sp. NPDC052109]|uniref:TetR/AcrR family transcriptional regulator n=1 Tax=Streptomyces sp. NPDC052109 TaxID=3155527 RepID=UPI003437541C